MSMMLANRVSRLSYVMIIGLSLLLVSCSSDDSVPTRGFANESLLLTEDLVPPGWSVGATAPVSVERFGFGNEDHDRWVSFVRPDDPERLVFSNHFVLQFHDPDKAADWYESSFLPWFSDSSIVDAGTWTTVADLSYQPAADQYIVACAINNNGVDRLGCRFMAQYEEFVVIFTSAIDPGTTTVSGFNDLVKEIDSIMMTHLQGS